MKKVFFLSFLFLLLVFLNLFPHFYAFKNTPPGFIFSGQASWFDSWDINVYLAAIVSGQENGLLLQNTFTTVSHQSALIYPAYTVAGFIFKNVNPLLIFYGYSVITTFVLLLAIYFLSQIFLKKLLDRLAAVFLISLGGGLSWLIYPKFLGADIAITGFTFTSSWQRPHEALGVTFYLVSLAFFYLWLVKKQKGSRIKAFLFSLPLICFYPYYFLSLGLISLFLSVYVYLKKERDYLGSVFLSFVPLLVLTLFYFFNLKSSTGFTDQLGQSLKTVNPLELIIGYGVLGPIMIYQLIKNKKGGDGFVFLNLWFWASLVLSFMPLGFARFYLRTLFVPAVILTLKLVNNKKQLVKLGLKKEIAVIGLIILLPISSLFIFFKRIEEIKNNNPWYYLPQEAKVLFEFLNQEIPSQKNVLANYHFGNQIPSHTKARVYFGHLIQTPAAQEKINQLSIFYQQLIQNDKAKSFLKENEINYVLWTDEEKQITQKQTIDYPFLKPVLTTDKLTLFEVLN